jgi:tRNA G46 methylase TrmB
LRKIKQDGEIIIATDWANYTEVVEKDLINLKNKINFQKFENHEVVAEKAFQNVCNTNFARRAKAEGRGITIFILKKNIKSYLSLLKFVPNFSRKF